MVFTFIGHFPKYPNHRCLEQTSIFLTLSFSQLSIQTWNNTVVFGDTLREMRDSLDTDTVFEFGCFVLVFFLLCGVFFFFFIIFFSSVAAVLLGFAWKILVLQTKRKLLSQRLAVQPLQKKRVIFQNIFIF